MLIKFFEFASIGSGLVVIAAGSHAGPPADLLARAQSLRSPAGLVVVANVHLRVLAPVAIDGESPFDGDGHDTEYWTGGVMSKLGDVRAYFGDGYVLVEPGRWESSVFATHSTVVATDRWTISFSVQAEYEVDVVVISPDFKWPSVGASSLGLLSQSGQGFDRMALGLRTIGEDLEHAVVSSHETTDAGETWRYSLAMPGADPRQRKAGGFLVRFTGPTARSKLACYEATSYAVTERGIAGVTSRGRAEVTEWDDSPNQNPVVVRERVEVLRQDGFVHRNEIVSTVVAREQLDQSELASAAARWLGHPRIPQFFLSECGVSFRAGSTALRIDGVTYDFSEKLPSPLTSNLGEAIWRGAPRENVRASSTERASPPLHTKREAPPVAAPASGWEPDLAVAMFGGVVMANLVAVAGVRRMARTRCRLMFAALLVAAAALWVTHAHRSTDAVNDAEHGIPTAREESHDFGAVRLEGNLGAVLRHTFLVPTLSPSDVTRVIASCGCASATVRDGAVDVEFRIATPGRRNAQVTLLRTPQDPIRLSLSAVGERDARIGRLTWAELHGDEVHAFLVAAFEVARGEPPPDVRTDSPSFRFDGWRPLGTGESRHWIARVSMAADEARTLKPGPSSELLVSTDRGLLLDAGSAFARCPIVESTRDSAFAR